MKKIIVCVLSIAVLFAFAACEASTPVSYYGKNVDSITLLSAPDYVQGETLNPADLSFRVVYNNGETATRNGAELGLAPTSGTVGKDLEIDISGNYVLDATNTFGIAYGTTRPGTDGKYTVKDVWTVEIKAADPAQLTYVVDPTNAAKEIKKGTSALSAEDIRGIVVTAKFDNGNTKVVPATIAKIDADDFTVDASGVAESTTTVKSVNAKVTIDPAWTLTIKEETNKVTDLKLEFAKQEIFEKAITKTKLSDVKFNVVATFEDGKTERIASTALTTDGDRGVATVDFTEVYAENTFVQDRTNLSYAAVVTYDGFTKNTNLIIEYTKDYPKAVVATNDTEYTDGQTVSTADFKYVYSNWASGKTDYTPDEVNSLVDYTYFDIANAKILAGEQINSTSSHSVTLTWKNTEQKANVKITVNTGTEGSGVGDVKVAALPGSAS